MDPTTSTGQAGRPATRLAYATLGAGDRCAICNSNPCVGHDRDQLVRGLMSAGLIYSSLGGLPPDADGAVGGSPYRGRPRAA